MAPAPGAPFFMAKRPSIGENTQRVQKLCTKHGFDYLVLLGRKCPDCNVRTTFTSATKVYGKGKDFGDVYLCPKCDAYVGCHKGTTKAYGRVANKYLRRKRGHAHKFFDNMWQRKMDENPEWSKGKARRKAYKWLSKQMALPVELTHIGMFDIPQCQQVIELCRPFFKKNSLIN